MSNDSTVSVSASTYSRHVLSCALNNYIWWLAAILAIPAVMSFYDIRFLLVALMLVFIIYPFGIGYFYFWHCLKQETRLSIMPKSVSYDSNTATITLTFLPKEDGGIATVQQISMSNFANGKLSNDMLVLQYSKSKYLFLLIPVTEITTPIVEQIMNHFTQPVV